MNRPGPVRAVWSDFGGVLTPPVGQTLQRFCADAGVTVETFRRAMRQVAVDCGVRDPMAPLDTPLIGQREWEIRMERALAEYGEAVDLTDFPRRWFDDREVNRPWIDTLGYLRDRGLFVGMLSNMPPGWDEYWRQLVPPDGLFDAVVLSFQVGCRKPEPAIFEVAADRAGVTPAECLLVDDLPANCEAARAAGWRAVCFEETVAEPLGRPGGVPGGGRYGFDVERILR